METKPGYKTSEFWLLLAAHLAAALIASGVFKPESVVTTVLVFVSSTLGQLGYTASRAWLKAQTPAPAPDKGP